MSPVALLLGLLLSQPLPADDEEANLARKAKDLNARAVALYRQGKVAEAVPLAQEALALRRQLYPPKRFPAGHPDLAQSLNNLGLLLEARGEPAQAEPYYRQALAMCQKLYPKERFPDGHAHLAATLNNLGMLLRARGELAQAEPVLRQALAMQQKLYPKERFPAGQADLATSLNNLGLLLQARGELAQAELLYRQALAMRQKLYPKERFPDGHADLAQSLNNLGVFLKAGGELAQAESYLRQAVAMRQKLYPKERFPKGHADLAGSLNDLGRLLHDRGELAEAELFHRQALAMRQKLYPKERFPKGHADLAGSLNNLGALLTDSGELAQAEPFLRQALAMDQRLYPKERCLEGHPNLATSLNNLGMLLQARGELAQAEPVLRQALAMRQKLYPKGRFPAGHADLATSLNNLGFLLQARRELAAAEPFYRQALAMRQKLYPPARFPAGHPNLALSLNNLGVLLWARGELAAAEPFYRQALAMQQKLYPPERFPFGHPHLALSLNNLGTLLNSRGELAQAQPFYRQALAMWQKLCPQERFPAGHPDLAGSLNNLGMLMRDRGELVQAEPVLRQALAMEQRLLDNLLTGSAEVQALNYLAKLPLTRDSYLSVTRALPQTTAACYVTLWESRAALARWLAQRRLAALAADDQTRGLAQDLLATRRELAALLLRPAALDPKASERVRQLTQDKEKLEQALARRLPAFDQLLRSRRRSPDELRRALPAGVVLIDLLHYLHFEQAPDRPGRAGKRYTASYVAFLLSRDLPARRVELGPAAPLEDALASWRAALTSNPQSAIRNPEGERPEAVLRRLVWDKLAGQLPEGMHTVYLCPDAALTALPWAALPGRKAGTVLLEDHALAVVPHGAFLLEALERPQAARRPAEDGTVVAVGGVAYGQPPVVVEPRGGPAARRDLELLTPVESVPGKRAKVFWPALADTQRESERLLKLAGGRTVVLRQGAAASTEQLLADLPQARWTHLATHGFFASEKVRSVFQVNEKDYEKSRRGEKIGVGARSPLVLSGLVLAGANLQGKEAPADGGILSAEAIAGLDLDRLELAVLSACDTGLGEVGGGEGVFGLQRAFHIAGCQNVIASLWQVDDEATAALMALFYYHLWKEGQTPLEALRQAQLTLYHHPDRISALARARGPNFEKAVRLPAVSGVGSAPRAPARLWAGFVLSGAGR
jgi:CHAT domain-containing protein/tetratricopeptide (TPR) repeat protein